MSYYLSPVGTASQISGTGAPLSGGFIYTYAAGTSTPFATYTDSTGATPQANPVVLNTQGLPTSPIWFLGGQTYKFQIKDSAGNLIRTLDNLAGINDTPSVVPNYASPVVKGLVGSNNSGAPTTKFDIAADTVTLRNSSGATIVRNATGSITCDFGLAGSVANGRDQAGAFAINTWVYLYFIWNGTTLATLASTTTPNLFNGTTLPSGYTHWSFATAVRWNGSSNIIPVYARGSFVYYDDEGVTGVLASGVATAFTTVSCASLVPPICLRAQLSFGLQLSIAANTGFAMFARATGSGSTSGRSVARAVEPGGSLGAWTTNTHEMPVGTSQSVDYRLSSAPTGGGASINVSGYVVPNGGE